MTPMVPTLAARLRRIVLLCLAVLAAATMPSPARAGAEEDDVKAAFVYQFGTYVEWPAAALANASRLLVCVVGDDTFSGALDKSFRDKRLHARPLAVRPASAHEPLLDCHILFVAAAARPELPTMLATVDRRPILTIADDCAVRGGGAMIEFVHQDNRLRFAVNTAVAQRAGLTISSQLLKLAVGVASESDRR